MNKYLKKIISLSVVLPMLFIFQFKGCAQQKKFMAGAAKSSITPSVEMKERVNRTPHDELYVKTLVLDDGETRIAFLIADNQGIPTWITEEAKSNIQKATGIPKSNIIISATHTHSGIVAATAPVNFNNNPISDYQRLIIDRMVESTENAVKNLQPAKVGWGSVSKPEHVFNRRWYMKTPSTNPFGLKDSVITNPGFTRKEELVKPAGPTDPEVSFLAIKSISDEPIAILANYSLHYVGGGRKNDISADYYGEFDRQLIRLLDAENNKTSFIGIMSNGTSGDINNINYASKPEQLQPYEKIKQVATDIAQSVVKAYNEIEFQDWAPIKTSSYTLDLKLRKPSEAMNTNLSKIATAKTAKSMFHAQEKKYATRIKNFTAKYPKIIKAPINTFIIGDLAIAAIPFEVFAETGLELKSKSPFDHYFTIGLANGHWGYLPTPEQHKKGGYESWITISRAEEDASDKIVSQVIKQLNELKQKK